MYINLYHNVMIMEYVQENGAWIMLSHPGRTLDLLLKWNAPPHNEESRFLRVFL